MNPPAKFQPISRDSVAFLGTDPVPAKAYYDPAWYELERKAVFQRSWQQVAHICELPEPGSWVRRELEVLNASLLIVRGKDGMIRAFHNVCTHRGTQLVAEAQGKQAKFSCPYHMWTFGTDGALLSAPEFERFNLDKKDCALKQVRLEVCAGLIFVSFDPKAPPLRDWLGDLAGQMETLPVARATTFSEYVYEIDANWKLTYDNFQENYHLRFIHPRTGEAAFAPQNPYGYPKAYGFHDPHRTQTIWSNPEARPKDFQAVAFGRLVPRAMAEGLFDGAYGRQYFGLFPSLFMLGTPLQNFVHQVYPLSATKSRGVIRIYWLGEDATASERFGRETIMGVLRDVHAEDVAVIEAGQRGLSSGALTHIHFQEQEALCRHLFNMVSAAVETWQAGLERQASSKDQINPSPLGRGWGGGTPPASNPHPQSLPRGEERRFGIVAKGASGMSVVLPEGFVALEPFVETWAVAGAHNRDALRGSEPVTAREAFFAAMTPLLVPALDHLDQTPLAEHDAAQHRLMLLALSYAHVALAVDVQGPDEGRHAVNRQRLPITRAPADL